MNIPGSIFVVRQSRFWIAGFHCNGWKSLTPSCIIFLLSPYITHALILVYLKELVNLMLTGKAVSNVFDDSVNLNWGSGNDKIHFFSKILLNKLAVTNNIVYL